jgi:hypothetical protein
MIDTAEANGQTYRTLIVDGREFKLYDLHFRELGELQQWIDRQFPDPIKTIAPHLGSLPIEVAKFAMREAQAMAARPKPRLGLAEADIMLVTNEGLFEVAYLAIRAGDPAFTRPEWDALRDRLTPDLLRSAAVADATGLFRRPTDPAEDSSPKD